MICLVLAVLTAALFQTANSGLYLPHPHIIAPPIVHYPLVHSHILPHPIIPLKYKAALHGIGPYYPHKLFLRSVDNENAEPSEDEVKVDENVNYYNPKVVVTHNGKTMYNSEDKEKNAEVQGKQSNETGSNFPYPPVFVDSYGQPIIIGPYGQQLMPEPYQSWVQRPSTESVILDQSQSQQSLRPNLIPQNLQTPPFQSLNEIPIMVPQLPPVHPFGQIPPKPQNIPQIPQHLLIAPQIPPNSNKVPQITANPQIIPHIPINPQYVSQLPLNIQPNPHGMAPLPQMITNIPTNPYTHQVPLEPITNHHPTVQSHMPVPPNVYPYYAPHHSPQNLPAIPPPQQKPCSNSLYGKKNSRGLPLNILSPNEYMDSIDKYMHPYIFTK